MKGLKKMLVLLTGLVMFLCANPVLAEDVIDIEVPYVLHGGDWWTGLALTNTGSEEILVSIHATQSGTTVSVDGIPVPGRSQVVRLLPDFFTEDHPYPTENDGRSWLWIRPYGRDVEKYFKFTLFVGNSDGFAFESYDGRDRLNH